MQDTSKNSPKQYPPGHFMTMWITFGIPIGLGIGIALENPGLGPALGVAIGATIGAAMETKAKSEGKIRELTEVEKQQTKKKVWLVFFVGILVAASVVFLFFK